MKTWIKEHFDTLAIVGTIVAATWTIKSDMHAMDIRLTAQIHELDVRLSGAIRELDARLTAQIHELDVRLSGVIHELDARLTKQIAALENRVIVIETVMIMQGAPIRAIAAENENQKK